MYSDEEQHLRPKALCFLSHGMAGFLLWYDAECLAFFRLCYADVVGVGKGCVGMDFGL